MTEILFLGDVVPYCNVEFKNKIKIAFNLECPITPLLNPTLEKVILGTSSKNIENIFGDKIAAVSLANNHIFDYGIHGFKSTIDYLKNLSIKYFGAGLNDNDASKEAIIQMNGMKIAFIGATCPTTTPILAKQDNYGVSKFDMSTIIDKIHLIRSNVDRIVIFIHWGKEESSIPNYEDILKAKKIIDEGADVIIGSHSHCVQPIQKYKKGLIAYGLGNFIMPTFINIPSYYTEDGAPKKVFTKRQMFWNRLSIGIQIDLETLNYEIMRYFYFKKKVVHIKIPLYSKYINYNVNKSKEEIEYDIYKNTVFRARVYRMLNKMINMFDK